MKNALDKLLVAINKEKQKQDFIELFRFDFNDFHFDYHGNYYGYGYFKTKPQKIYEYSWNNFDDMLNIPMENVGKTMHEILSKLSENDIELGMTYKREKFLSQRNVFDRFVSILENKKIDDVSFVLFYKNIVIYLIKPCLLQIRDEKCNIIYERTISDFNDLCSVIIPNMQITIKNIMQTTNQQYFILK